jgi:hypothetical protein
MCITPPCPPLATRTSSPGRAKSANIFPRLLFTTVPVIHIYKLNEGYQIQLGAVFSFHQNSIQLIAKQYNFILAYT